MKPLPYLIALAATAAIPALAQGGPQTSPYGTQQGAVGQAQQSSEFRERAAELPPAVTRHPSAKRHPGTLRKFNTGTSGGPEVQFDADRRAAREAAPQPR